MIFVLYDGRTSINALHGESFLNNNQLVKSMSWNLSLHIGVNTVDYKAYGSTKHAELRGCVKDAWDMRNLAERNGYHVMAVLENSQATFEAVEDWIYRAVVKLKYGGTFLLTFSGHGARMGAIRGESDLYDEGFVLYDLVMKDNYLDVMLRMFNPGSRVIIVADCCHSETIYGFNRARPRIAGKEDRNTQREECRGNKRLDREVTIRHQGIQHDMYEILDKWYRNELAHTHGAIMADGVVLSACRDNQQAMDGPGNGVFTYWLLNTLRNGGNPPGTRFKGTYRELIRKVGSRISGNQEPQCTMLGPNAGHMGHPFFQGPPFLIM